MDKKRILMFFGIVLAATGLICFAICIFREGENQMLLGAGLLCNSIAFLLNCIIQHMGRKKK